jgi:glucan phosphoethanolaminetransferase (alkaline phosphatase superfamily)
MEDSSRINRKFDRMFPNATKHGDRVVIQNIQKTDQTNKIKLMSKYLAFSIVLSIILWVAILISAIIFGGHTAVPLPWTIPIWAIMINMIVAFSHHLYIKLRKM